MLVKTLEKGLRVRTSSPGGYTGLLGTLGYPSIKNEDYPYTCDSPDKWWWDRRSCEPFVSYCCLIVWKSMNFIPFVFYGWS